MAGKNDSDQPSYPAESGIYIDASALAKLYVPEPESEVLDKFFRNRTDLVISELTLTEVISAVGRRRREGVISARQAGRLRDALFADANSGSFRRIDLAPAVHRLAEHILFSTESIPLRTLDALHIALALLGEAKRLVTFDARMADAAALHGLSIVQVS